MNKQTFICIQRSGNNVTHNQEERQQSAKKDEIHLIVKKKETRRQWQYASIIMQPF